ncbi:flippase [Methanobacterium alcaliphilum]|uniref:flippase n=1 Tax=Methanobacterium alcaliphilum TaxID=392018 RepID=UPI00200A05B8|nr:flippase [Methanobacterium alcaliphilum]MCK9150780.1 flippase [Methanobacterium alcaliphilum]
MDIIRYIKEKLKSEDYRVLVENFFSLSALQVVGYILPLITVPYLTRTLGVANYGLVNFAMALMAYFKILTEYGFGLSAVREISIHRDDPEKVSEIFSAVMIIKILLTVLAFCILYVVVFSFSKFSSNALMYLLAFGWVIGYTISPMWFFQGMERMKYITILNVLTNLIFVFAIFAVVRSAADFIFVPLLYSLGIIISGLISLVIIYRTFKVRFHIPSRSFIVETFKDSTNFFLSGASASIYTSSNTFFLGIFTNNTAVGYYSAAEKLYVAMQGLYAPLLQVIYPYMAKTKNKVFHRKIFKSVTALNAVFCVLLIVFSGFIVNLLFGPAFGPSTGVLQILAVALIIVIPSMILGYPFLAVLGQQKYANGSVVIGAVVHLGMILVISSFMNIYLVAGLVVFTELVVLSIRAYGVKRHKLW